MFTLNNMSIKKVNETFELHRYIVTSMNVYFQNIRALKLRDMKYISDETYKSYYSTILADINLETPPIETIIPNQTKDEQDEFQSLFSINTEIPEYKRVSDRITLEDLYETIPETNDTHIIMREQPGALPNLIEEIFIHFVIEKYLQFLDELHLEVISNMKDTMEYVVNNIDEKQMKSFIHTNKINLKKTSDNIKKTIFIPEYKRTMNFYAESHDDIPIIDVEKLLGILFTNTDSTTDLLIVTAIYLTLSFAMVDIVSDKIPNDQLPHVVYVRDVLSKIC